jgi:hypothetical protein
MRRIRVAAAQLGPIQKDESRQAVVARMLDLLDEAAGAGADLVVYPQLALITTAHPHESWFFGRRPLGSCTVTRYGRSGPQRHRTRLTKSAGAPRAKEGVRMPAAPRVRMRSASPHEAGVRPFATS